MRTALLIRSLLVTTAVLPAAVLPAALFGDALFFHPADGTTLERTFALDASIDLADADLRSMGEPVDPAEVADMLPNGMSGAWELEGTVTDAVVKAVRGRVEKLVRSYDELLVDGEAVDEEEATKRVEFVWNSETDAYDVRLADGEEPDADEERMLGMLAEDLDHRRLLPTGEVEVDATWDVELGADGLMDLALPLFELAGFRELMVAEAAADVDDPEGVEALEVVLEALETALEDLALTVTYRGASADEDSGRRVGRCDVEIDFDASIDLGALLTDLIERQSDDEEGPTPTIELDVVLELTGEGTFAWDLEGRHMHHFDLPLEIGIVADGRMAVELEGLGELEFLAGTLSWDGEATIAQRVSRR